MRIEDSKFVVALRELEVELRPASSLSELTSLSIGGNTDLFRIKKNKSIPPLPNLLSSHGVPPPVLGGASNPLVNECQHPWAAPHLTSSAPAPVLQATFTQI